MVQHVKCGCVRVVDIYVLNAVRNMWGGGTFLREVDVGCPARAAHMWCTCVYDLCVFVRSMGALILSVAALTVFLLVRNLRCVCVLAIL